MLLRREPAGSAVTAHSGLGQHAMARDNDRDRVLPQARPTARGAEPTVPASRRSRASRRTGSPHRCPYSRLETATGGRERQVEPGQLPGEIGVELLRRFGEQRAAVAGSLIRLGIGPAYRDDQRRLLPRSSTVRPGLVSITRQGMPRSLLRIWFGAQGPELRPALLAPRRFRAGSPEGERVRSAPPDRPHLFQVLVEEVADVAPQLVAGPSR